MIAVATKLSKDAAQSPTLLPNLELTGPTKSDDTKVPMVINDEMSCCTVGSIAHDCASWS
jgi:hypothetical protein